MNKPEGMSARDLREWYETVPESAIIHRVSELGQWSGIQVMRASHRLRRFRVTSGGHVIMVYRGEPTRCEVHQGGYTQTKVQADGHVYFFPAGQTVDATFDGKVNDDIYLKLFPDFLDDVAAQIGIPHRSVELILDADPEDHHLQRIAHLFDEELASGSLNGKLFGESLATALAVHLLQKYATVPAGIPLLDTPLAKAHLRRVISYIHDHLTTDLSLKQIAAEVGYSPYHLHRLFKAAMGKPLHQYVIEARLAKARTMLTHGTLPIAMIANAVGFSDQGHMARHLKRLYGLTPSQLRNSKTKLPQRFRKFVREVANFLRACMPLKPLKSENQYRGVKDEYSKKSAGFRENNQCRVPGNRIIRLRGERWRGASCRIGSGQFPQPPSFRHR